MNYTMDLIIYTTLQNLTRILKSLGFKTARKHGYASFKRYEKFTRIHIYAFELDSSACGTEIHVDLLIHFLFLGVYFGKKPLKFFENELKPILDKEGIKYKILGGFSWFSRRNKAILREFKTDKSLWL